MSQLVQVQRNRFGGSLQNYGGTFIAGAVINSGGGDIYINSQPADGRPKHELDLLDKEGLCLLSLSKSHYPTRCTRYSVICWSSKLTYVDGGALGSGHSALDVLTNIFGGLNAEREKAALPKVKPCEVFDLIGGTGVGG